MTRSKISLDSLQGWWETPLSKNGVGLVYVKNQHVYIKNVQIADVLKVCSGSKLKLGKYSGFMSDSHREINWGSGKVVWTHIGELPDMHDPETKQGRFKYTALLGKGANGIVCEATDLKAEASSCGFSQVAVKVLRLSPDLSDKELYESALRLHREYRWSRMFLHNTAHKHYSPSQARFFLQYFEDHTGSFGSEHEQYLEPLAAVAKVPYIVMELAQGKLSWNVLFNKQDEESVPLTMYDRCEFIRQLASALEYLGRFDLLHRDLHFHNIFISRGMGQLEISIGDLGMMSNPTQKLKFVPYDEEDWKMRDWVPWEAWNILGSEAVRSSEAATVAQQHNAGASNWQAFDIFSLGVLHMYLCLGQIETRRVLEHVRAEQGGSPVDRGVLDHLILNPTLAFRMISKDPNRRPTPGEVLNSLPTMGLLQSIFYRFSRLFFPNRAKRSHSLRRDAVENHHTDASVSSSTGEKHRVLLPTELNGVGALAQGAENKSRVTAATISSKRRPLALATDNVKRRRKTSVNCVEV